MANITSTSMVFDSISPSSSPYSGYHSGTDYFLLSVIIINAVMAVIATFLNFLVILTFLKTASLRETPSNILILGLAIADFGVGAIAQPTFISNYAVFVSASSDDVLEIDQKKVWNVFHAIADMFMLVSFLNIIAITVDRFLAVHLHLRYQDFVTTKRYGITLFLIWIFSSGLEISNFMLKSQKMFISLLALYVSFGVVNIAFLVKVSQVIHRHSLQIQAQKQSVQQLSLDMPRYKKSVNTMYYVTSAFLLSFISSLAFGIFETFFDDIWRRNELLLDVTCWSLVTINSVLNPIIYCIRVTEIRNAIAKLLKITTTNEYSV